MKRGGPIARRKPLKRKTALKRKVRLERKSPITRKAWVRKSTWKRTTAPRRDNPTLRASKLEVRQRSGGACESRVEGVCQGRGHHAHHVVLRARGGPDTADNLLWVCWSCHHWIHTHIHEATLRGLISSLEVSTRRPGER